MKRYFPYYKYLRRVKWQFAGGVIAGVLYAAASGAGIPLMVDIVFPILFNEASKGEHAWYRVWLEGLMGAVSPQTLLLVTCLWIPAIFLLRSIASYFNSYLIQYVGQKVLEDIRVDLFRKLQSLPLAFFKNNTSGDLLSRLMGDTAVLRQIVAGVSSDLIKQPITLLSALGYLIYKSITEQSFFIAMIALATVPVCILVIRAAGRKLAKRARILQAKNGSMTAALSEALQAPLEIRAYNLEQTQVSSFQKRTSEMLVLTMKVVKYRSMISPAIEIVAAIGFAFALYLGVSSGMGQSQFLALGAALFMAFEPIKKLGTIHSQFKQADASVDRIEYISNQVDDLPEPPNPQPVKPPTTAITFENLSFAYTEVPVLKEVNVSITPGQVVALIGPSGAGKSTFAHLIPRFYDPQAGRVTFDGMDVREFSKKDLRNSIAVVPQMPSLFIGTIAENIRVGKADATDEEVIAAARKANADEFIRNLANGYETQVGERGESLSGGQRQRIAISRAFLKDAPILILDEATSAQDSESEAMVQQALAALVKGRTTFIIAHRFSTITIADRILVFQDGRIVADGNHQSLRENNTIYQAMIRSQMLGMPQNI